MIWRLFAYFAVRVTITVLSGFAKRFREFTGNWFFSATDGMEPSASAHEVFRCWGTSCFNSVMSSCILSNFSGKSVWSCVAILLIQRVEISCLEGVDAVSYRMSRKSNGLFCILLRLWYLQCLSLRNHCATRGCIHCIRKILFFFWVEFFADNWGICQTSLTEITVGFFQSRQWVRYAAWMASWNRRLKELDNKVQFYHYLWKLSFVRIHFQCFFFVVSLHFWRCFCDNFCFLFLPRFADRSQLLFMAICKEWFSKKSGWCKYW